MFTVNNQKEYIPFLHYYVTCPIQYWNPIVPEQKVNKLTEQKAQPIDQKEKRNLPIIPICIKAFQKNEPQQTQTKNQNLQSLINIQGNQNSYKNNQNRNILPNSLHQIMSYVQKLHKSGNYTLKIFKILNSNPKWTVKRYYTYQKALRDKINYYLKQSSLKLLTSIYDPRSEIYSVEQQHFYMKVSRILAMHYIKSQSIPLLLTSKRMTQSTKLQHLKNRRQLRKRAEVVFRQQ